MNIKIGKDPSVDTSVKGVDYKLNTDDRFISRHHAFITVESKSPLKMNVTAKSVNKTFINGKVLENNKPYALNIDDALQLVSIQNEPISIKELLTFAKIPLPKAPTAKQYKPDFLLLKDIYDNYKKESTRLTKKDALINGLRSSVFALSTASVGLIAILGKEDDTTMKLVKIGIPVVVVIGVTLFLNSISPRDKIIQLNDQFEVDYICPNCSRSFGKTSWTLLARQNQCAFCKTPWTEENK
ncbi:FHA domain-containing protein [Emticicia sp. 17c]|uniref:FHA domain-containing protein n=1 Tax=Emticicia sp. 17c TaxID=3127704 RepID=UPI00301CC4BB